MNIRALTRGRRIKRTEEVAAFGAPKASKPTGTCESDGIRIPTQITRPRFSKNPLIQRKRAAGLSQAWVTTKDGKTDFDSAWVRLPISVALANVRTRAEASLGEMANTRLEVATRIKLRVPDAINSTRPRSACRRVPSTAPGNRNRGSANGRVRSVAGRTHSMSVNGISSTRKPQRIARLSRSM